MVAFQGRAGGGVRGRYKQPPRTPARLGNADGPVCRVTVVTLTSRQGPSEGGRPRARRKLDTTHVIASVSRRDSDTEMSSAPAATSGRRADPARPLFQPITIIGAVGSSQRSIWIPEGIVGQPPSSFTLRGRSSGPSAGLRGLTGSADPPPGLPGVGQYGVLRRSSEVASPLLLSALLRRNRKEVEPRKPPQFIAPPNLRLLP